MVGGGREKGGEGEIDIFLTNIYLYFFCLTRQEKGGVREE